MKLASPNGPVEGLDAWLWLIRCFIDSEKLEVIGIDMNKSTITIELDVIREEFDKNKLIDRVRL